jgi:hypothetical protein
LSESKIRFRTVFRFISSLLAQENWMTQEIQRQINDIVIPAFQKIKTELRAKGRFVEILHIPFDEKATLEVSNKGRFEIKYILTVNKNRKGEFIVSSIVETVGKEGERHQSGPSGPDELTSKKIIDDFYKEYNPLRS